MSASAGTGRGLRPDTFPFLAVLLCAMGSLILLLLVMDRRAKAVARAKLQQAAARAAEDDALTRAARQEEWERRRAALHAALLRQDEDVRHALRDVQARTATAAANVDAARSHARELSARGGSAREGAAQQERALAAETERVARAGRQTGALHADRARLTAELEQMERTLADLQALRRRQQQTYSVVPYHGKHGDNRRPLYVECAAGGLVFHPDRKTLGGADLAPLAIRAEVERRLAQRKAPAENAKPYLLLLVRPDGVETYYRTQAALVGLTADFGYELIDAGWVLAFPEDEAHVSQPRGPAGTSAPDRPAAVQRPAPRAAANGPPAPGTTGATPSGQPGMGTGTGTGASGAGSPPAGAVGSPPAGAVGIPRVGVGVPSSGLPGGTSLSTGSGGTSGVLATLAPPSILGGTPGARASPPISAGRPDERGGPTAGSAPDGRPSPGGEATSGAVPAPRRGGARDWVIAVECKADGYVLHPGSVRVPNGDNALSQAVRQEIARRQALAPYRPHVRYLVRPDGVRTYYRAFPLLEALGVPMTRQNLLAGEEVGQEHLTR